MSPELDAKLCAAYPSLYRERGASMQESCMHWGFECGDGWYDLLDNLSKKLTALSTDIVAQQVKEKFGTLRFYTGGISDENRDKAYDYIEEAERLSMHTCEMCGHGGELSGPGWLQTLCVDHRKEKGKKTYAEIRLGNQTDSQKIVTLITGKG